ncbi:hypothetical protein INR49_019175 [Caranx melampygus]|nr:hypothetical protein INR49_019175 [Caranx melampygus]
MEIMEQMLEAGFSSRSSTSAGTTTTTSTSTITTITTITTTTSTSTSTTITTTTTTSTTRRMESHRPEVACRGGEALGTKETSETWLKKLMKSCAVLPSENLLPTETPTQQNASVLKFLAPSRISYRTEPNCQTVVGPAQYFSLVKYSGGAYARVPAKCEMDMKDEERAQIS